MIRGSSGVVWSGWLAVKPMHWRMVTGLNIDIAVTATTRRHPSVGQPGQAFGQQRLNPARHRQTSRLQHTGWVGKRATKVALCWRIPAQSAATAMAPARQNHPQWTRLSQAAHAAAVAGRTPTRLGWRAWLNEKGDSELRH